MLYGSSKLAPFNIKALYHMLQKTRFTFLFVSLQRYIKVSAKYAVVYNAERARFQCVAMILLQLKPSGFWILDRGKLHSM